jgi:hypothetical protein
MGRMASMLMRQYGGMIVCAITYLLNGINEILS